VSVATECLALKNFLTTFEIVYGLSHNSVYRLHGVIKKQGALFDSLPEPLYTWFTALTTLTSPQDNYRCRHCALSACLTQRVCCRSYRKAMQEAKVACVLQLVMQLAQGLGDA
jgi:hypothetical protein